MEKTTVSKQKERMPGKEKAPARSMVLQRRETMVSYLFLLPALCFFVGFVITPMTMGVITSFTNASFADPKGTFVGLENYIRLFKDKIFLKSAVNTVIIVAVSVPAVTAFSLWVGSSIYRMRSGIRSFFRCVFYLPVVTGSVAVVVVWKWMFDKYDGLLNYVIRSFGGQPLPWTASESMALWCIILILFTTSIGQPIVLYVAALGNVDSSLEEAARVDGASEFRILFGIVLPMALPIIATIGLFYAVNYWNDYFQALLYISDGDKYTLQLRLRSLLFANELNSDPSNSEGIGTQVMTQSLKMASVAVATIPIILVYPWLQKYFVKGMTLGSVKG